MIFLGRVKETAVIDIYDAEGNKVKELVKHEIESLFSLPLFVLFMVVGLVVMF